MAIGAVLAAAIVFAPWFQAQSKAPVSIVRLPEGALQPQVAFDAQGRAHVVYFRGEAAHGNLFYTRLNSQGSFTTPLQVNSRAGSAMATGTIRGGHIAIGQNGRVHVAWHGSDLARPKSGDQGVVLYARMNDESTRFEPERNVVRLAVGLDAGTVAADETGHVYVAWHAGLPGTKGESERRLFVARSLDNGRTFAPETAVSEARLGACGCCGIGALAARANELYLLFRSASDTMQRDTYLLSSRDAGASYRAVKLQDWDIAACPMSSYALARSGNGVLAAWETGGQVFWTAIGSGRAGEPPHIVSAPGTATTRKHPAIAANARGDVLLAWTEGTGWNKGGGLAWQRFDRTGKAIGDVGRAPGVPVWSLAAVAPTPDGGFTILY